MSYINETDFVIENKKLVYPEIVSDGLQLYYDAKGKRDTDYHRDTMLDMSGNKNHGKLHNFAYEKHSGYKDGLVFDYIDDKLVRPALNLKTDDFTFMLNGNIISFSPDGTVKRVQDGEVIESKGFNLVRDNNWQTNGTTSFKKYEKYITTTKTQGGIRTGIRQTVPILFEEGNVIYCKVKVESLVENLELIQYNLRGAINQGPIHYSRISQPDKNKTYTLESVYKVLDNTGAGETVIYIESGDSSSENKGADTMRIKEVQVISLTDTFGAGNEPTLEEIQAEPDKWQWLPNPLDLIESEELKGNYLGDMENIIDGLYKTEVLSGEEIYTDKADDDAVVHVDIDGKSYQHAGSGKNLLSVKTYKGRIDHVTGNETLREDSSRIISGFIKVNPNIIYTLSREYEVSNTDMGYYLYNENKEYIRGIYGYKDYNSLTYSTPVDAEYVRVSYHINDTSVQLEEGSTATAYEPPAPTPDYPVEIHSLNDFDVVSSVGRGNLRKPSQVFPNNSNADVKVSNKYIYEGEESYELITKVEGGALKYWRLSTNSGNTPMILKAYTTYTFSWYLYGPDSYVDNYTYVDNKQPFDILKRNKISLGNGFFRYTVTIRYNSPVYSNPSHGLLLYATSLPINENLYISGIKIEVGDEATPYTEHYESAEYDTQNSTLYKINLLLDEPLRSVSDVKDRLFRDTDGVWKIERKVGEDLLDSSSSMTNFGYSNYDTDVKTNRSFTPSADHDSRSNRARTTHFVRYGGSVWAETGGTGFSLNAYNQFHISFPNSLLGVLTTDSSSVRNNKIREWLDSEKNKGTPLTIQYSLRTPKIETLSQELQDKLNNLRSFENSNYAYTVLPNENNNVSNKLKPTLNAKFLYNNWYKEDRVINNLMIYNRALTNEEMLQNYKTIKRRWGM